MSLFVAMILDIGTKCKTKIMATNRQIKDNDADNGKIPCVK
jgi:hypothetical protein